MIEYISVPITQERKDTALLVPTFLFGQQVNATPLEKRLRDITAFSNSYFPAFERKGRVGQIFPCATANEKLPAFVFLAPVKNTGISYPQMSSLIACLRSAREYCEKWGIKTLIIHMDQWGLLEPGQLGRIEFLMPIVFENSKVDVQLHVPPTLDITGPEDEPPTAGGVALVVAANGGLG